MTGDELATLITHSAVVGRPGDTLVIALRDQTSPKLATQMRDQLLDLLPDGAKVAIVFGAAGLAVYRAEP